METAKLNYDILLHLISLSERSTQLRLIEACKFLNEKGAKYVLSGVMPDLRTAAQLKSFLLFMRADSGNRTRHLKDLALAINSVLSKPVAESLSRLFKQLSVHSRLHSLNVEYSETLLSSHAELPRAISQLTSLEILTMYHVGEDAWAMVKALRSQLVYASVDISTDGNIALPEDIDLLSQFEHSQATLESLHFHSEEFVELRTDVPPPCYERMSVLSLIYPLTDTSRFVRAFPNLEELRLDFGCLLPYVEDGDEAREENRTAQLENHQSWDLELYTGTLQELHVLGITGRIEHLHLDDAYEGVGSSMLREVLADARPTVVELKMDYEAVDHFMDREWMAVLSEPRSPQIETLNIEVYFRFQHCEQERMKSAMDFLGETIALIGLDEFSLRINLSKLSCSLEGDNYIGTYDTAGTYFETFCLPTFAAFLAEKAPSLSVVHLVVKYGDGQPNATFSLNSPTGDSDDGSSVQSVCSSP